jgi:hypothetical protein
MLPYNDPETLMLLLEQRHEVLRRTMAAGRLRSGGLAGAARRLIGALGAPRRASRMRASRRPA